MLMHDDFRQALLDAKDVDEFMTTIENYESKMDPEAEFEKLCSEAGIEKGLVMDDGRVVNAGIYQFVKRQYTCCLSRDGERAGMDYWATQIATRTVSADDVARKFFYSEEFVNKNYSNAEYISVLYTTFMGRPSDQGGLNYWEEQMAGGMSREEVLDSFVASEEFQGILAKYGLK